MELKTAVDEMFRKVGRNLYIIQQVEMMLKAYLSHSSICGSMSEAGDPQQRQLDRFALQTMGGLATQYLCLIDPGYKYPENNSPDKFSVQFEIKVDSNTFMRKESTLTQMVADRNALTHHLIDQVDLESMDSCLALGCQLDAQRELLVVELNDLKINARHLFETRSAVAETLASDAFRYAFEQSWILSSPLVQQLIGFSTTEAGQVGWLKLGKAANFLNKTVPEEIKSLKARYGFSTLIELMR
ncbi:hypothetical protein DFR26_1227 [Paraperlucidibaca baekdonensis]|uniref:HTH OST-type domain-containing protein n=1 Tax=Paraperlucidibaca baekdonensis TaxID=748120 RepID=A0A3E0H7K1_9GAMM|nr:hypothetical protein [Paraperlucidibaca baekdonensis]REH39054.1 hypothetical protein DFR26_1227 [Paraperlucidibaca baekdonensis]